MADSLTQVGKYIRDTKKATDYNSKRASENFPSIERLRWYLDSYDPFKMEFRVARSNNKVTLSLTFYPGYGGCD
jgi:hypothetical protein